MNGFLPIAPARCGKVAIDRSSHIKFSSKSVHRRDRAVGPRTQTQRFGRFQASQEIIRFAKEGNDDRARLPVDATGFDDTPVIVTADAHALEACHCVSVYIIAMRGQAINSAVADDLRRGEDCFDGQL